MKIEKKDGIFHFLQKFLFIVSISWDVCLINYLSICLSVYLHIFQSVYLSICLSLYLSICLSIYLSICLSVYLSICLSVFLSFYLSVYLSSCLFVYLSICISVYLLNARIYLVPINLKQRRGLTQRRKYIWYYFNFSIFFYSPLFYLFWRDLFV